MTHTRLVVLVAVLAAFAAPVLAQPSAAGEWKVNFVVPSGTKFVNMVINQQKTTLSGTVIFPKQGGAIATNKKRVLTTDAACDLNTMGVVPGEALDPDYLYRWIDTLELGSLSDGSVVPQIKPSRVAELQIPLPSLDEQRSIVAEIERQLSLIDALRAAVESAQKRSAGLRRAILERAFRGELVPQDPDDEPATALLERIRAERAAAPPARRARTVRAGP